MSDANNPGEQVKTLCRCRLLTAEIKVAEVECQAIMAAFRRVQEDLDRRGAEIDRMRAELFEIINRQTSLDCARAVIGWTETADQMKGGLQ